MTKTPFIMTAALIVGLSIPYIARLASAEDLAPDGMAAAHRAALWKVIGSEPKLAGVDQIVVESQTSERIVSGWLQKRNWLGTPTALEKRFWARIDRICDQDTPECFRVHGIWSNGELLSRMDAR